MDAVDALSPRERVLLVAVLEHETLEAAASAVRLGVTAFRRRTSSPQFLEALREARRAAVRRASAQLSHRACEAVGVLLAVMRDDLAPHSTRVSVARTILEQTHRAAELDDVEERVAALEAWVAAPAPEKQRGNGRAH
jgi:hypothetical protein